MPSARRQGGGRGPPHSPIHLPGLGFIPGFTRRGLHLDWLASKWGSKPFLCILWLPKALPIGEARARPGGADLSTIALAKVDQPSFRPLSYCKISKNRALERLTRLTLPPLNGNASGKNQYGLSFFPFYFSSIFLTLRADQRSEKAEKWRQKNVLFLSFCLHSSDWPKPTIRLGLRCYKP